ncbi:sentrin-specific protease 5 [Tritrichomonas musculus]|uniref:Sentrin-specific protease 5 n=1 Tax=Tritrichomonas musculus TaxID=1915356 RepID=A0ABR2JC85_9EUKA
MESPYQDNKYDDGVFVAYHAQNIILDDHVEFSQSDIPKFRKQMLDKLMKYYVPSPKKSQTPQISPLSSTSQSQSPVPYDVQKEMFPDINPLVANNDSTAIPTSAHKLSDFYKDDLKNPFPKAKHRENESYIKMPIGQLVKSKFHTMEGTGLQPINMNNYIDQEVMEQYSSLLKCFGKKVKQIGKVKILSPVIYDFITGVHPQSRFYFKGMEKNDIITSLSHDNMEMKISEFDMVLWPIYHNLEHWILFVIRYKKGIIEFFDSTPFYDYPEVFLDIKKFIFAQNLKKKLKIKYLSGPSQKNWHDCGVFTMEVMMNLLHEGQMTWEEKNIPEIRIRIKEELKTCRLVDGFKYTVFPKKDDKKKIRQNKNI